MKKLTAIILTVVMLLALVPAAVSAAPAGTGIASWAELTDAAGTYYLTADITVDATFATAFTGTLDGNGHTVTVSVPMFEEVQGTVKNLTVAGSVTVTEGFVGAVAKVVKGGTIENVKNTAAIVGAAGGFAYTYLTDTTAVPAAGGIAGVATGNAKFINCANTAAVNSCAAGGIVGVVGYDQTAIVSFEGCSNSGKIHDAGTLMNGGADAAGVPNGKGEDNALGGIAGYGYEFASISFKDCANSGEIDSTGSKKACTGGIFGYAGGISDNFGTFESTISFENCSNTANVTGSGQTGGIAGWVGYSMLIKADTLSNAGTVQSTASYCGGIFGRASEFAPTEKYTDVNTIRNATNSGSIESYSSQAGGIVGYAEQFLSAYNCSNSGKVGRSALGTEKNQSLAAGGIFGKISNVAAGLTGVVENCTNTGEVYAENQMGGIIGWWGSAKNDPSALHIINCVNEGKVSGYGKNAYGAGIIGRMAHDASVSIETSVLLVKDCVNKGEVIMGKDQGAGIVGYNCAHIATFENCVNYADISVLPATDSTKFVGAAGGIQGSSRNADSKGGLHKFINCVNYGDLTAVDKAAGGIMAYTNVPTEVVNCENYGKVIGGADAGVGGIVGRFNSKYCTVQLVENCLNAGDVYNTNGRLGSIVGYSYGTTGVGANIINCVNTGNLESANGVACGILGYCNASDIVIKNNVIMGTLKGNKATEAVENGGAVKAGNFYSFAADGKTYYFIAAVDGNVTIEGTKVTLPYTIAATDTNPAVEAVFEHKVFETAPQTIAIVWDNKCAPAEGNISGNVFAEGYADYLYIVGKDNALIADSVAELTGTYTLAQLSSGEVAYALNQALGQTVFFQTIGEDAAPTNRSSSKEVFFIDGAYSNGKEPAPEVTDPVDPVPTGDEAWIYMVLAVVALLGTALVAKRREN